MSLILVLEKSALKPRSASAAAASSGAAQRGAAALGWGGMGAMGSITVMGLAAGLRHILL